MTFRISPRAKGVYLMFLAPKGLIINYITELSQKFRSELLTKLRMVI